MSPELIVVLLFAVLAVLVFGTVVLPRLRGGSSSHVGPVTSPDDVVAVRFSPVRFSEGYDMDEVDGFLDREVVEGWQADREVLVTLEEHVSTGRPRGTSIPVPSAGPELIDHKTFPQVRYAKGYDIPQVDAFLAEVAIGWQADRERMRALEQQLDLLTPATSTD